jgi:hypothetical protein
MTTLEHRFEGRQATARAIQAHVNRHLDATRRLRRIEVRLSSAVPVPTEPEDLRRLLAGLLSEQGQGRVELSLRRFERPLDNAGGEHLVRMIFEDAPATPAAPTRLRWWQRLFGSQPARPVMEAPREVAGIPARRAAEMLREALAAALRYDTAGLQGRPVAHVGISAHLPEIDATLRQMMPPLDPQAVQSVAAMLRRLDVSCQPDLRLDYRFEPRLNAEGTLAVLDADLRVRLSPADAGATAMPIVAGLQSTALPDAEQLAALRAPARGLRVRVLGTLAADFATPFEMKLPGWPARLDRAALEAAGFGREHGALLGVASQSCPLLVDRHGAHGLLLRPARRADAPMYYAANDLQPLPAELVVTELTMQLVLNCPAGVRDALTGTALPALRIELGMV